MNQLRAQTITRQPVRDEAQLAGHARRRRLLEIVLGFALPIALLGLWQLAAETSRLDPRTYPPPLDIVREGWRLATRGDLWSDTYLTLRRVLIGFVIGTGAGLVFGFVMGVSRLIRKTVEPLLNALYVVPKLALLPVFLTIFGFGETPKVMLVAVTVFFFVWIDTMEAVTAIPEGYLDASKVFGSSRVQQFRHVLLPATLPQLFVALRIAIGVAVLVIIAAEFVVSSDGLGYLIFNSRQLFINGAMYVGIAVVAVLGVLLAALVGLIGRRLTPWNSKH